MWPGEEKEKDLPHMLLKPLYSQKSGALSLNGIALQVKIIQTRLRRRVFDDMAGPLKVKMVCVLQKL